jgi:two-component system response regulator FixJ
MSAGQVHVIDDDPAVRDSLASLLEAVGHAVTCYPAAGDFLTALPAAPRGCVITDVQMPGLTGIELLQLLQARLADFPVVVLTGRADVPLAVQALKAGASDFIEKPFDPGQILGAVRTALERQAEAVRRQAQQAGAAQRLASLSAREREVLRGLVDGASNKEIARDLDISPRTVESYRANIMMKMQASSLSELVRLSLQSEAEAQV